MKTLAVLYLAFLAWLFWKGYKAGYLRYLLYGCGIAVAFSLLVAAAALGYLP